MESPNLKELSSELIKKQKKVVATITIVDDGETTAALIAGEGERLLNMLATAMVERPELKQLIGRAYLAATIHDMKS